MASIATESSAGETKTNHTITNLVINKDRVLGTGGSDATVYEGTASIEGMATTSPSRSKCSPRSKWLPHLQSMLSYVWPPSKLPIIFASCTGVLTMKAVLPS